MQELEKLAKEAQAQFSEQLRVKRDVPSRALTTFSLGAPLALAFEPLDIACASELVSFLRQKGISWRVLGAGSNVVLPDSAISEPVLHFGREFNHFRVLKEGESAEESLGAGPGEAGLDFVEELPEGAKVRLFAASGVPLMSFGKTVSDCGLSGLEFAAGIPASLGGALRMNAGAHGEEISTLVESLFIITPQGELERLKRGELAVSYRRAEIPEGSLVLGAELVFKKGKREEILSRRSEVLDYRRRTQPLKYPSAGSVFRNPSRLTQCDWEGSPRDSEPRNRSAGWLLERAGLKGHRAGGVAYSELHANWLIKLDDSARATDVAILVEQGKCRVEREFGVVLRTEIKLW